MVSPKNSEDNIAQPLIENNSFLPQYSSTEPTNFTNGSVLTPTGSINFNMSFVFSLLVSFGALLFASTVWYIASSVDYFFFIWHPTLMAMVLLMATQGSAVLQKAESRQEKDASLNFHKLMQSITFLSVIGGFYVIYTFKAEGNKEHFTSPHGKSGLITFLLILIQTIAGSTLVNFPGVVGGAAKARADWTKSQFDHLWVWLLAAGMVLVGTIGGINSNKLKVR
ncbi:unnamed protein product [Rhizophagus irregularis]|nr:unnamed protein product [Rhizophagus irregularis]CAB5371817.1 unnamed protein product [Rhizophagus irregularis]